MPLSIRFAENKECGEVVSILKEAAEYLDRIGQSLWVDHELEETRILDDVSKGL